MIESNKAKVIPQTVRFSLVGLAALFLTVICFSASGFGQSFQRDLKLKTGGLVEITNLYGRVRIEAKAENEGKVLLILDGAKSPGEKDLEIHSSAGKIRITVKPQNSKTRLDLTVKVPERIGVKIETDDGEVSIDGNIATAEVLTDTGTILTNIPLENLKYDLWWTQSRPRYMSDVEIEKVKERIGGRFSIIGKYFDVEVMEQKRDAFAKANEEIAKDPDIQFQFPKSTDVALNFRTARGIILLNVDPSEVSSDLRMRPLTDAAKAVIRSGDSMLMEAIRRTSPKYFGDYLKTLPPRRNSPTLSDKLRVQNIGTSKIKQVIARVVDVNNRAVAGLEKLDFVVTEYGKEREILSVKPVTAPFNLVLLLDISGSVENYVNFIRKAARNFLGTMSPQDKIAIVIFNEDVKQISTFTTDRGKLSESLDTFDAGGATGYYDAIAFALVDTLKPFKGDRTALVVLSDGDDNRSFLPFDSLLASIQESGALIYPLYVPSALVAASAAGNFDKPSDPLRIRYMGLTSKAEGEGARLAEISGGVFYPIRRLDDLQKAYRDIVLQLRTAYTVTFRSDSSERGDTVSPRLRIKVMSEGTFVNLGAVTEVSVKESN